MLVAVWVRAREREGEDIYAVSIYSTDGFTLLIVHIFFADFNLYFIWSFFTFCWHNVLCVVWQLLNLHRPILDCEVNFNSSGESCGIWMISAFQIHNISGTVCTPDWVEAPGCPFTGYLPELIIEMGVRMLYTQRLSTHFICQCEHCSNRSVVSRIMSICFLATPMDVS